MKFSLPQSPMVNPNNEVCVGNVYRAQGGRAGFLGYMYVVVAMSLKPTSDTCSCFIIDTDGNIVGTTQYAEHYLREKAIIAFCEDLETLTLNVQVYNGF